MIRLDRLARTLGVLVALAALTAPAHAGLGDALKQRAMKAVKGEKKPAATATSAAESGAIQSRIQPPMTPENIAKFKASMQLEIAERERAAKFLATVKSKEAYQKCRQDWLLSAEGQKHSQAYISGMEGKSGEALQKHVETVAAEMEKALTAKCGPDPDKYNESWKYQQAREALGRASDQFAKGDDYAYQSWKEWIVEFCKYIEKLKKEPDAAQKIAKIKDEGLRIPGQGTGIYFVYTATEANQLLENCDSLMPLIEATY